MVMEPNQIKNTESKTIFLLYFYLWAGLCRWNIYSAFYYTRYEISRVFFSRKICFHWVSKHVNIFIPKKNIFCWKLGMSNRIYFVCWSTHFFGEISTTIIFFITFMYRLQKCDVMVHILPDAIGRFAFLTDSTCK